MPEPQNPITAASAASPSRLGSFYQLLAFCIAAVLAALPCYTAWDFARRTSENEARIRFEFRVHQLTDAILGRMADYEQVLRGGVGLFAASSSVDRHAWTSYVQHLRLTEIYPGIQGIGVLMRVPAPEKERHEGAMRAAGFAAYAIWPAGEREEYVPVVYIEPFSGRNVRSFGYDMAAEPTHRAALERARDSGEPVMSARVTLVQETDQDVQAGFLMYLPVYRNERDIATTALRQAALVGYVFSPFRMDDLMQGILGPLSGVRLEIFDMDQGREGPRLYDSGRGAPAVHESAFTVSGNLQMRGRAWKARFSSLPEWEQSIDRTTPALVAVAGGAASALALAIIWSLVTTRARAVRLARSMTVELRASKERLALAIEGSNEALVDWDVPSGRVLLSGRWSQIVGGGPEVVTTTVGGMEALVHPEDLPRVREQSAGLLTGQVAFYHVDHRIRTAGGGWRWISSRAKAVERAPDGTVIRVAGTSVDVTDRKEMERLKNEFIGTVSHELRTPLTAVLGALGLLKREVEGKLPANAAMFLGMAHQNSERLALLINDVLDLEKIESGSMEFRIVAVPLGELLERAVELNAAYARGFNVRLELARPVPDVAVRADPDRLMQVLTNLLSNAAKFSPAGGAVTVAGAVRDGSVRISVSDKGPGVPQEFRGRIFAKFAQADASDTRRKGGTGLGLSICRAIVENLGGTIDYVSEPGQGATFFVDLPLAADA